MRQVDKKKGKDKVAAMIMLCFCLVALTSIFTIKASIDKVSKSAADIAVTQETPTESAAASEDTPSEEEDISDDTQDEDTSSEDTETASSNIPTVDSQDQQSTSSAYLCPMDMEISVVSKDYSMDMVIYNETLDQYMTHPGIDIEAPTGSGVKAIADGTVTDIYTDDAYGTTIEITHADGMVSKSANLDAGSLTVEIGDAVTKGQQIGSVGQTALYESMEKCHLHFELYQDGLICNPNDYITF